MQVAQHLAQRGTPTSPSRQVEGDDLVPATLALGLSYLLFPLPIPGSHSNGFTACLDLKEVTTPLQLLLCTIV